MNFGRCSICTLAFDTSDVACLKCGHAFHNDCIARWIKNSKTCPNCRMSNTNRDITRLFFDELDKSSSQIVFDDCQPISDVRLIKELKEAKDAKLALELAFKEQTNEIDRQLRNERVKAANQHKMKDQHIRQLESQLIDQGKLKEDLAKCKRRLEACEFYNLLMKNTCGDEKAIDKYLNKDGSPDDAKFLKLMRNQRDEEIKKTKKLSAEFAKERQEKRNKEKEIKELRKELECLRKELDGNRKRKVEFEVTNIIGSATAPNKHRSSFGFSFTDEHDKGDIISAAKNFAFDGDSSIEILMDQPTSSKPILDQFDPITKQKALRNDNEGKKLWKKPYLPDELSEVFSAELLSCAKKANL